MALIAGMEKLWMHKFRAKRDVEAPEKTNLEAFERLQSVSHEFMGSDQQSTIAALKAQTLCLATALGKISQGVCLFDGQQCLILSNARYAEIYRLESVDLKPGTSLREISERRSAVGTCPMEVDTYLAWCDSVNSGAEAKTWTTELKDGRTIQICYQPMPDGGWLATHEDITDLKLRRSEFNERASFQALINSMPESLWVKDEQSRFIIANNTTAAENNLASPADLIGKTDFDLFAPDLAQKFIATEEKIIQSGQPMIDEEECIFDASGMKWRSTTKLPLLDGKNEIIGLVGISRDITELKTKRAAEKELMSLQALIDWVPSILWVKDVNSRFLVANKASAIKIGLAGSRDLIGKNDFELHPPQMAQQYFADEQRIIQSGQAMIEKEEAVIDALGVKTWIATTKMPLRNNRNEIFGLIGVSHDVTERRLADTLRESQAHILEMIAMGAPLEGVLDHLVRLVESQLSGIIGSVLLLDEDGQHLRHGAAPTLAESYLKAIEGVRIGPKVGSCGTAAYLREPVIVKDIMSDPLWEDYRELAAKYNYRSCWSTPIQAHDGTVLGVFAMYSTTVREPTEMETHLIDVTTRIAGIAIERKRAEDQISFLAHHDALTGLPNRALLKDRLTQAILQTQRHNPWVSVVFIDLDGFKAINDSLGHTAGDELLKVVATRMVGCIKATDTVVRLGGDEFVILLV
ncbi:MAG: PAS domain-containing protein, partial [Pseudomonadota bacterium]|nr:PAS domain-containing protein [Pseudomonadota bacterium]